MTLLDVMDGVMGCDGSKFEERWCAERRGEVAAYLAEEHVMHGSIGNWPAWHWVPYASIWAVESNLNPGRVGWWVISGDLPTDYLSAASIKHPRDAIVAFSDRWRLAAECMVQGKSPPGFSIGSPEDWPVLSPMLASRAKLLKEMFADDDLWSDS